MTYNKAKKKIIAKWLIGAPIFLIATTSSVISVLKMFYFGLDNKDQLSNVIIQPVMRFVEMAYQHTHFLEYFWIYSPTPTPRTLTASENVYSLAVYLCIFLGMAFIGSARVLSARLAVIDKQIEDEMIRASVTGDAPRQRQEIQKSISVPKPGLLSQIHTMYLAPLIVGVLVAVIAKFTGLI